MENLAGLLAPMSNAEARMMIIEVMLFSAHGAHFLGAEDGEEEMLMN